MPPNFTSRHSRPSPARRAAFDILLRVETQASFASELLNSEATADLSERDAALCTEIVMGTLRWQATLDFIAQSLVRASWQSLDPEVRVALRMGLYQLRALIRVPARAAVHETVELVKLARKTSAASLVNAVLRRSAAEMAPSNRTDAETEDPQDVALGAQRPPGMSDIEWLSVKYSHPAWLLQRWVAQYGRDTALELARKDNEPPPTFIRFTLGGEAASAEEILLREGIGLRGGRFLRASRIVEHGNIAQSDLCRTGRVTIQDEGAQMVPYLLDVQAGARVLDVCAAPGNKTIQLAEWAGPSGRVIACDMHFHRLSGWPSARLNATNIQRVVLDGTRPLPFTGSFDRILVDVPCSGTGTLRRHPEIKWRLRPVDIQSLAEKQLGILNNAAPLLAPGGRLVYATCSLEAEENRGVIEKFLGTHTDFHLFPVGNDLERLRSEFQESAVGILDNDFLQTFTHRDDTDGFFAAILGRKM
jgi:16S rRNA (cytosine967-C5)-methyltransferase